MVALGSVVLESDVKLEPVRMVIVAVPGVVLLESRMVLNSVTLDSAALQSDAMLFSLMGNIVGAFDSGELDTDEIPPSVVTAL